MKLVELGQIVEISKGKKHNLSAQGNRYIQIDDLRNSSNIKYTDDSKGTEVEKTDLVIVWDGAYSGLINYGLS
jgi:hypothetical protein